MDMERVRGCSIPGSPPPKRQLEAADKIDEAKAALAKAKFATQSMSHLVIEYVCGKGFSIEQTAREICGIDPKTDRPLRKDCEKIGFIFKAGLTDLANLWSPDSAGDASPIRTYRAADAKPSTSDLTSVPQARAVHATGKRLFRTG